MENATKAILIAGGILIAIITISIFYSVFSSTSQIVGDTSKNTHQEELKDFNTKFEAYNKKIMYGTDIISVLNKAIDNNRNYDVLYGPEPNSTFKDFYVDIEFTIFERDQVTNQRKGSKESEAIKKTYKLSSNYTKLNKEIEKDILSKVNKKDDDIIRTFKFSGFKCTGVEYVASSTEQNAIRKSKENDISRNMVRRNNLWKMHQEPC